MFSILLQAKDLLQGKATLSQKRSKDWPRVRKLFLTQHPVCALCNNNKKLEVHHLQPFHTNPELELDPTNLITLCESKEYGVNCHLFFGHLGNYKLVNTNVIQDTAIWYVKLGKKKEKIK